MQNRRDRVKQWVFPLCSDHEGDRSSLGTARPTRNRTVHKRTTSLLDVVGDPGGRLDVDRAALDERLSFDVSG